MAGIKKTDFSSIKKKFSKEAEYKPDRFFDLGDAFLSATGTGFLVDKLGSNGNQNWDGAIYFWLASGVICLIICTILAIDEYKKDAKKA